MRQFYREGVYRLPAAETLIYESLTVELTRLFELFAGIQGTVEQIVTNTEGRRQLELAGLILKNLKDIVD